MPQLHYATIGDIRSEAGFQNATNLSDWAVGEQRRAAEAEIDTALGRAYVVPFAEPVPDIIRVLTTKLAAAMLRYNAYRDERTRKDLEVVRKELNGYANGEGTIPGADGVDLSVTSGVDFYFGDEPRMFSTKQRF